MPSSWKRETKGPPADGSARTGRPAELQEEFSGDSLARQFESLEYHGSADQQLLELKRKMGLLGAGSAEAKKQIGAGGAQGADVHEAEIEEETK